MKQLLVFMALLLSAAIMYAQDIITLNNGQTINAQVAEVGINEVKYYKSANLQGPVYVAAKSEVRQITYANGSKDVFAITQQQPTTVIVQQPAPQTVIVRQQSRRRNNWNSGWFYPVVSAHIDLGRHGGGYNRGYGGGHHGRRHH